MKKDKYKQLVDVHLQNRIWRNELEMALIEIDFWEDLLEPAESMPDQNSAFRNTDILSQLHHYQRLAQNLLIEVQQQNKEVAEGVQLKRALSSPTPGDRLYLREQMDRFRANFQAFKNDIRLFVIAQPSC